MADDPFELIERSNEARRNQEPTAALNLAEQAISVSRARNDKEALGAALAVLARLRRDDRQHEAAVRLYEESAALARELGDEISLAHRLRHIGDVVAEQGDLKRAEDAYAEAEKLFDGKDIGELTAANFLRSKALLRERQGESSTAIQLWKQARALYAAARIDAGVAECERRIAHLH